MTADHLENFKQYRKIKEEGDKYPLSYYMQRSRFFSLYIQTHTRVF